MAYREDVFDFALAIEFKKTPVSAGVFSLLCARQGALTWRWKSSTDPDDGNR
jgi:hypothetical protein